MEVVFVFFCSIFFFSLTILNSLTALVKNNLNENLTKTKEKSTTKLKQETLVKNTVVLWVLFQPCFLVLGVTLFSQVVFILFGVKLSLLCAW